MLLLMLSRMNWNPQIPDKVMKLAESLELNIFPTKLRS